MSNSEDKNNMNGVGDSSLQRLASLKAPRDLSLGGVKPNKKIFTPNLNVARNKNKGLSSTNSRDNKKDDKGRRDRRNDRNKDRNGPKVIKSTGVFSEGLGSIERHSSRISYGRDSDSTSTLQKPTIRVKDVIKIDKELEEKKIKAAFGNDSTHDEECEDFKNTLDIEAPIKLPLDDGGWSNQQAKAAVKIKQEVVVKEEPTDGVDAAMPLLDEKPPVDIKEVFDDNVANLLRSDKTSLILLQLTDALPGRGGGDDDRKKQEPSTSDASETEKTVDNRCRFTDLEEGKIGKLRIHRSGKVTLALGDSIFEVNSGAKASFYQEAVSMAVDEHSRSANLISLGPLHHKLNISPHWEQMFNNMAV